MSCSCSEVVRSAPKCWGIVWSITKESYPPGNYLLPEMFQTLRGSPSNKVPPSLCLLNFLICFSFCVAYFLSYFYHLNHGLPVGCFLVVSCSQPFCASMYHCFCKVPYQIKFSSIFCLNPQESVINCFRQIMIFKYPVSPLIHRGGKQKQTYTVNAREVLGTVE
jgi:hypothetical protein